MCEEINTYIYIYIYLYMHIHIHLSLSISLSLYIYIYIYYRFTTRIMLPCLPRPGPRLDRVQARLEGAAPIMYK